MIETFVTYVRAQTSVNVLRIDEIATASGIAIAGIVPKTKSRMTSAPAPPMNASVTTLGPLPPPLEALWSASRPVRLTLTPAGTADRSGARGSSLWVVQVHPGGPAGEISAEVVGASRAKPGPLSVAEHE